MARYPVPAFCGEPPTSFATSLKRDRSPNDKHLMRKDAFETATRRSGQRSPAGLPSRYLPQIVVSVLVVVVLAGGAFYASRLSEGEPQVVYSASLDEIAAEEREPLLLDINTADAEELEELPEVGPATAEAIVEYRRANGSFQSVDELEEVPGIGPKTLERIRPFATVR